MPPRQGYGRGTGHTTIQGDADTGSGAMRRDASTAARQGTTNTTFTASIAAFTGDAEMNITLLYATDEGRDWRAGNLNTFSQKVKGTQCGRNDSKT